MTYTPFPAAAPLSYKDAGVDIDAGDALIERIKPLAKKTMREGVLAGIGGFGAMFEVSKKFKEPVLVSGTDTGSLNFLDTSNMAPKPPMPASTPSRMVFFASGLMQIGRAHV